MRARLKLALEYLVLATGTARRELSGVPHSVRVSIILLVACEAAPIKMFVLALFPLSNQRTAVSPPAYYPGKRSHDLETDIGVLVRQTPYRANLPFPRTDVADVPKLLAAIVTIRQQALLQTLAAPVFQ